MKLRTLFSLVVLLSLVAPVLAGSQNSKMYRPTPEQNRFRALVDQLQAVAPNTPRRKIESKTFIVKLSSTMTLAIMEGTHEGEVDHVSFHEKIGDHYQQTDISLDGTLWRRYMVAPKFSRDNDLGQQVWVLGWQLANSHNVWIYFDSMAPKRLARWTMLLERAIALRQAGQGIANDPGLLIVAHGQTAAGEKVWNKKNAGRPDLVMADTSLQAAALARLYVRTHGSAPVMAVGFDDLNRK